jgi:hypothetical protein
MAPLAQTTLQPEAIGVLVVLGVALAALAVVGAALLRSRRRRRREQERLDADAPGPSRFAGQTADGVITAADRALYERDGRTVAAAALWLHEAGDRQALPYLLHALRTAPAHHREGLLRAAAQHGPDELADHPLLAASLPNAVLDGLRDRLAAIAAAGSSYLDGTDRV